MGVIEKFMPLVMEREDDGNMAPIVQVSLVWFWLDRLTKDEDQIQVGWYLLRMN